MWAACIYDEEILPANKAGVAALWRFGSYLVNLKMTEFSKILRFWLNRRNLRCTQTELYHTAIMSALSAGFSSTLRMANFISSAASFTVIKSASTFTIVSK